MVPKEVRQQVRERAKHLCEYCHSSEDASAVRFESQLSTQLFNPRSHEWNKHFVWEKGGLFIRGKTPIGRATCDRLDLKDQERSRA